MRRADEELFGVHDVAEGGRFDALCDCETHGLDCDLQRLREECDDAAHVEYLRALCSADGLHGSVLGSATDRDCLNVTLFAHKLGEDGACGAAEAVLYDDDVGGFEGLRWGRRVGEVACEFKAAASLGVAVCVVRELG